MTILVALSNRKATKFNGTSISESVRWIDNGVAFEGIVSDQNRTSLIEFNRTR